MCIATIIQYTAAAHSVGKIQSCLSSNWHWYSPYCP